MVATYGRSSGNQVFDSEGNVRRNASNPTPTVSRKTSEINGPLERESSVNRRALTGRVARESASVNSRKPSISTQSPRRNLPWLGVKPASREPLPRPKHCMPGGFDVEGDDTPSSTSSSTGTPPSPATVPKSKSYLLADPSIRPIGSMPSLHETPSQLALARKASSAGSNGAPSSAAPVTRSKSSIVPRTVARKLTDTAGYTESEYSTTPASTRSVNPAAPVIKRPCSYEELVGKPEELEDITEQLRDNIKEQTSQTMLRPVLSVSGRKASAVPASDSAKERVVAGPPFVPLPQPPIMVNMMRTSTMPASPLSSIPGRKPSFTVPDPEGGLRRAITGLEDLMQEAISVAKDAAEHKKPEEVSEILEEAAIALRRASTAGLRNRARMEQLEPLPVSDSELNSSDESSMYSDDGSSVDGYLSHESSRTVLTAGTHPSQVLVSAPYAKGGRPPRSDRAEVIESVAGTPPRFYNPPSVESITRDFAYPAPKSNELRRRSRSSASLSSIDANTSFRRAKTGLGTQHVNFPIEPAATLSPRREQVDHVLRPVPTQQAVDEHIQQHSRLSSLNHEEAGQVETQPRPRRRRKPERDFAQAQERSRQQPAKELDYGLEPYKPDPRSTDEKRHGGDVDLSTNEVGLRRKHHFSIRGKEGFSLSRHHRHQPVARNWRTSRKRITAAIACTNTGLLGYIIGVYVGCPDVLLFAVYSPFSGRRGATNPVSAWRSGPCNHPGQCIVSSRG